MPFIIVGVLVAGGLAGVISRYLGPLWGLLFPAALVAYTVYAESVPVHPDGAMGKGMFVIFFLVPLCVASVIGYGIGLVVRRRGRPVR